jgi:hypothetical protein
VRTFGDAPRVRSSCTPHHVASSLRSPQSHTTRKLAGTSALQRSTATSQRAPNRAAQAYILQRGRYTWSLIPGQANANAAPLMLTPGSCAATVRAACAADSPWQGAPLMMGMTPGNASHPLPYLATEIAAFQLMRGPHAYIGYGVWGMSWPAGTSWDNRNTTVSAAETACRVNDFARHAEGGYHVSRCPLFPAHLCIGLAVSGLVPPCPQLAHACTLAAAAARGARGRLRRAVGTLYRDVARRLCPCLHQTQRHAGLLGGMGPRLKTD